MLPSFKFNRIFANESIIISLSQLNFKNIDIDSVTFKLIYLGFSEFAQLLILFEL